MPLRFRRTFKILPGVKVNLSKGGVSTSFGVKGFHVNVGKRGVRPTVSVPSTGISYTPGNIAASNGTATDHNPSSLSDVPGDPQPSTPSSRINGGLPPQTTGHNKLPLGWLIAAGIISVLCTFGFLFSALIGVIIPPPKPTVDTNAIYTAAMLSAVAPYTQTALAFSPTPLFTPSPLPTVTTPPTIIPTPTLLALLTSTVAPLIIAPQVPTIDPLQNVTAVCNDGTYSYSAHRQGTCSHHGGVRYWVHKPPN